MGKVKVQYVSIKNYAKYQRYKDRSPLWVKLYYSILDDPEFLMLSEVNQARYIKLILVASRCDNKIRYEQDYLSRILRTEKPVDLSPLFHAGFLVTFRAKYRHTRMADIPPHSLLETETETETEKRKEEKKQTPPASAPVTKVRGKLTDEEFLAALKASPAYAHVNFDIELAKMDIWLLSPKGHGRSKTRQFIVNWLNKLDKPIGASTAQNWRAGE